MKSENIVVVEVFGNKIPPWMQDALMGYFEPNNDTYHRYYPKENDELDLWDWEEKYQINDFLVENGIDISNYGEYDYILFFFSW